MGESLKRENMTGEGSKEGEIGRKDEEREREE